jgi:short-subunit dehydrogenase
MAMNQQAVSAGNSPERPGKALWAAVGLGALIVANAIYKEVTKYKLRGKVVLITGGSRGLGLVLARQLARKGAKLAICSRTSDQLDRARQELEGMGAQVIAFTCDVTDRNQVHSMMSNIRQHYGRIDVLINNAGVIQVGPLETMTIEDYEEAMKAHFWAPLYTMMDVIPQMKQRGEGRIVNVTSVGGKIALPHMVPYSASKFALVGLSEGMRSELKKDNVLVTTVVPDLTRTGSPRNVQVKGDHQAEYAWFKIADSLPLLTQSAEAAAARIITAIEQGEAEVALTFSGRLLDAIHGIAPGFVADVMGFINEMLPEAGPGGTSTHKGYELETDKSRNAFTASTDKAARKNNEM